MMRKMILCLCLGLVFSGVGHMFLPLYAAETEPAAETSEAPSDRSEANRQKKLKDFLSALEAHRAARETHFFKEVHGLIEAIGALRTEQAKDLFKHLMTLQDHLKDNLLEMQGVTAERFAEWLKEWNETWPAKHTETVTLRASAGPGGEISPAGVMDVPVGRNRTFTAWPDDGYEVVSFYVDGVNVGKKEYYQFKNLKQDHDISVVFAPITAAKLPQLPYEDVRPNQWFFSDVMSVTEKGIMTGVDARWFAPNTETNRAMVMAIFMRMSGAQSEDRSTPFNDVAEQSWYATPVAWAAREDLAGGYPDGSFHPEEAVSRQELVAFFHKYANFKGQSTAERGDLNNFADADAVAPWAEASVRWAVANGLLGGDETGQLRPEAPASRAELAAMIVRMHI